MSISFESNDNLKSIFFQYYSFKGYVTDEDLAQEVHTDHVLDLSVRSYNHEELKAFCESVPEVSIIISKNTDCTVLAHIQNIVELIVIDAIPLERYQAVFKCLDTDSLKYLAIKYLGLTALPESIKECKNLQYLNLRNNNIQVLPDWITQLSSLRGLNAIHNYLQCLPEQMGNLSSLQVLNLSWNKIQSFPDSMTELQDLQELDISHNSFISRLEWIGMLSSLQRLNISGNHLMLLPDEISSLTSLQFLDISDNELTILPDGIKKLSSLKELYTTHLPLMDSGWVSELTCLRKLSIQQNWISALPNWIADLSCLEVLDVSYNSLTELPEWIGNLSSLQELNISWNSITTLPDSIGNLSNLRVLDACHNKLDALTDRLSDLTNLQSLCLDANRLSVLPDSMADLTNLCVLNIKSNLLKELPTWVINIPSLQFLDVSNMHFLKIPKGPAMLPHLQTLNIEKNNLTFLPKWISELTSLKALSIHSNYINTLPDWMAELTSLYYLDISYNGLKYLPEWIGNLNSLQILFTNENQLHTLPESMAKLLSLSGLNISGNLLQDLPDWISKLTNLKYLYISSNNLQNLPDWMANLTALECLDVSVNNLQNLPDWMANLISLKYLYVHRNNLQTLPDWLASLQLLSSLDVSRNPIQIIPDWIGKFRYLTYLNISKLTIDALPEALFDLGMKFTNYAYSYLNEIHVGDVVLTSQQKLEWFLDNDRASVHAYFEALKEGSVVLRECKIIFLGDGNAGKTHTIQRLINHGNDENINPKETPGVKIEMWKPDNSDLKVHLWDFGGQDIMHSMHRCFLTQRCLYVIILRKRQTGQYFSMTQQARYWLNNIKSFAPGSKVLLITNRENGEYFDVNTDDGNVNTHDLGDELTSMLVTRPFSYCAKGPTGDQFDKLTKTILDFSGQLEIVNYEFPKRWNDVREELDHDNPLNKDKDPVITAEQFDIYCTNHGITDITQKKPLLDCLNALGVCFSYHDISTDYRILDPEWLTNAIYAVINSNKRKTSGIPFVNFNHYGNGHGSISHREILDLLNDKSVERVSKKIWPYNEDHVTYILELMRKFHLSYQLDDGLEFVPAICPEDTTGAAYDKTDTAKNRLLFYIQYSFLPDSIIHMLMVECAKDNILDSDKCYFQSFCITDRIHSLSAVVDMKSTQDKLYISVYDYSGENKMWSLLRYLREKITEINNHLNIIPDGEYLIAEGKDTAGNTIGNTTLNLDELLLLHQNKETVISRMSDQNKILLKFNVDNVLGMVCGPNIEQAEPANANIGPQTVVVTVVPPDKGEDTDPVENFNKYADMTEHVFTILGIFAAVVLTLLGLTKGEALKWFQDLLPWLNKSNLSTESTESVLNTIINFLFNA